MAESHPVQSGSGTQAGQEGDAAPGSSRLHGRQEGPGGHPPPDPWGRVTSPRGERSPQDCSSWVRGQEPLLLIFSHGKANLIRTCQMDSHTGSHPKWPTPSAALWFPGLQGQRGPLYPSSLPTRQESPSTVTLLQVHDGVLTT